MKIDSGKQFTLIMLPTAKNSDFLALVRKMRIFRTSAFHFLKVPILEGHFPNIESKNFLRIFHLCFLCSCLLWRSLDLEDLLLLFSLSILPNQYHGQIFIHICKFSGIWRQISIFPNFNIGAPFIFHLVPKKHLRDKCGYSSRT